MRAVERVLVVEDDPALSRSLQRALAERFSEVRVARTRAEAAAMLRASPPDLLLLDVVLPDGTAADVLRDAVRCRPIPTMVAMSGEASSEQSFELAQLGVRGYVSKPLTAETLGRTIDEALKSAPILEPTLRATVGQRSLREVEREVRATMVSEALARSRDNRRGAARLLSISRQMLQHILRRHER